jgi:serine protease Do
VPAVFCHCSSVGPPSPTCPRAGRVGPSRSAASAQRQEAGAPPAVALALLLLSALGTPTIWAQEPPPAQGPQADGAQLCRAQQEVFRAALRTVAPSIVRIETIGGALPVEPAGAPGAPPAAVPGFRQADGPTTGVICTDDGYILTSSINFLRDPAVITAALADGRRFLAKLVARDAPAGLALLKIDATALPVPRWLPPNELRPGQWALVAGYGQGSDAPAVSVGVVSAVERLEGRAVQTDAKTSPANYGGPLFDLEGRVMGVCIPKAGSGADELAGVEWYDSGIGFAIRADYIQERLPRLKAGQDLQRGFLGVRFDSPAPVVGSVDELVARGGVRITAVGSGPASDAGLQPGDVITHMNGHSTPRRIIFRRELARLAAGDAVQVTYRRGDQETTVTVKLATAEELQARAGTAAASQPTSAPGKSDVPP